MHLMRHEVRCGSCGETSEQTLSPASGAAEGNQPPDFDTRPNGPVRATIQFWMQRCPHCGYCASDISAIHVNAANLIASLAYQRQLIDSKFPPKACEFLCHAMILDQVGQQADAGWTCLHAAWVCDDEEHMEAAVQARDLAIDYWRKAKKAGQDFGDPGLEGVLITDLLRRMSRFEDALINCAQALDEAGDDDSQLPPLFEHLLRFEKTLIQKRDPSTYRLSDLPAFRARTT
jgi:hypothetical protein